MPVRRGGGWEWEWIAGVGGDGEWALPLPAGGSEDRWMGRKVGVFHRGVRISTGKWGFSTFRGDKVRENP